jgi:hypothetical protein
MLLLLQANAFEETVRHAGGTGLEWMTIASIVIPALLLIVLMYVGSKQTV